MSERSFLTRALWFVFIGWWLTPVLVNAAWLLGLTVILLPISVKLINLVPTALTLKTPNSTLDPDSARGQHNLLVRALYFVFVGWWLSFLWANVANLLAVSIIGLPVAIWMLHRLPFVLSLYRYDG
ncbi:YccF domain-containing protein [Natronomonas gomsonensis]|uniref:YccF domain-containing protein n=1 Tax=Natronomonas gomsonensis TaxID=1046043 RepID=UPI0015BFC5FB|nr:YccF domain-containing protein [Natronomonas gomsonensis]